MRKILLSGWLIFIAIISFYGCKKCGESIDFGDFALQDSSIANWFPYLDKDQLRFENQGGETVVLSMEFRDLNKTTVTFRETCNEGLFDTAQEFYHGDFFHTRYTADQEGDHFVLDIYLYVTHINDYTKLTLYDQVSFNSGVFGSKGDPGVGGAVSQVASYRGNTIPDSTLEFLSWVNYAESVEIQGKTYEDVYFFLREGVPSLYVQKYKGIIAFAGFDGDLWVIR